MSSDDIHSSLPSCSERGTFICGVVEGFYGRPWTTGQRKELFGKLNRWGMDSYVYAPKDDYKVSLAAHLQSNLHINI